MNIAQQVYAALDAAHKENAYPHDYARDPGDVVEAEGLLRAFLGSDGDGGGDRHLLPD